MSEITATCVGCGCKDDQACWDEDEKQPCSWLVVDRDQGLGVCSVCPRDLERWDDGDRTINIPDENNYMTLEPIRGIDWFSNVIYFEI